MNRSAWAAACAVLLGLAGSAAAQAPAWFPVGERLTYRMYWGFIPVGTAELSTEWIAFDGGRKIAIRAAAQTTSFMSHIYAVDDRIETIVDPETFLPIRYEQRLSEGRHRRHDLFVFDHAGGKAYWRSLLKQRSHIVEIDADTRDVLSLLYYMRSQPFAVDEERAFRVVVDEKLYDLIVTGLRVETRTEPDGEPVETLKVEPQAKFGEIFLRKGRVHLWFTEDARRLCVLMTGKMPIASVRAVLTGVTIDGEPAPAAEQTAPAGENGE
jgi:hypothetical protein